MLYHLDILSLGCFVLWTVCPLDDLPSEWFVLWTVCRLDGLSSGNFILWAICFLIALSMDIILFKYFVLLYIILQTICPRTFCPLEYLLSDILLSRIFVFSSLCRQLLSIFECFFVLTFCPLDFLSFGQFVLCNICLLMYLLKDTFSWNAWIFYLRKMFVLVYFEVWTLYNFMDKILPSVNNPVFNKHFPFQTYQYLFSRKISSTPSNATNQF